MPDSVVLTASQTYKVIEPLCELVTGESDLSGRIVNPSTLVYGEYAALKVGVPEGTETFSPADVRWSIVSGPGRIVRVRDWEARIAPTKDSGVVVVEAAFSSVGPQPRFELPIVKKRVIPIKAFVIAHENAVPDDERLEIEAMVSAANIVFQQIGVSFVLTNITYGVGSSEDWNLVYTEMKRNGDGEQEEMTKHTIELLDTYSDGDCVEVYFLGSVRGCEETERQGTKALWSPRGILAPLDARSSSLTHELGHALGLKDCYDEGDEKLTYGGDPPFRDMFFNQDCDWPGDSGRGFYRASDKVESLLMRFVMYGYDCFGMDVPADAVYSMPSQDSTSSDETFVRIGAFNVHANDVEVYSR